MSVLSADEDVVTSSNKEQYYPYVKWIHYEEMTTHREIINERDQVGSKYTGDPIQYHKSG